MVIALGWPQFYDIPGLRQYGLTLDSLNASRLVHDRIEESLIAFDENPEEKWRTSIIVAGGGLSGVELIGELADSRAELAQTFDLRPQDIKLYLIEGSHVILGLRNRRRSICRKSRLCAWTIPALPKGCRMESYYRTARRSRPES